MLYKMLVKVLSTTFDLGWDPKDPVFQFVLVLELMFHVFGLKQFVLNSFNSIY